MSITVWIVNRVLDYVDSDLSVTKSIPELCRIAEVDERTLRNYFYTYFSISPKKYLNCYRLNVVRKALLTLDTIQVQIADAADMAGLKIINDMMKSVNPVCSTERTYPEIICFFLKCPTSWANIATSSFFE